MKYYHRKTLSLIIIYSLDIRQKNIKMGYNLYVVKYKASKINLCTCNCISICIFANAGKCTKHKEEN